MRIALTGATGFIGRYIARHLAGQGHAVRCWYRPASDRSGMDDVEDRLEWIEGDLADPKSCSALVDGCAAVTAMGNSSPGGKFVLRRTFVGPRMGWLFR